MKTKIAVVCTLVLGLLSFESFSQTGPCTSNTPSFTVDLTGKPTGSFTFGPIQRSGQCCGAIDPDVCLKVTITLDTNAVGFRFDITSGAIPSGAMYYQVGCNERVKVGDVICLDGTGPHVLTFCKPGNNQNEYTITSIPKVIVPDSIDVNVGCALEIGTLGYFIDSTLEWHDLTSSNGEYLKYLNCIKGCDTVLVTPDYNAPAYIDYEVCGRLIDTVCQNINPYLCKTIRVNIYRKSDTVYATTCANELYPLPGGGSTDSSGIFISILQASGGCDSIVYTEVSEFPAYNMQETITSCDSALCKGKWYYTSQLATDSFVSAFGCDSVVVTDITIHRSNLTQQQHTSCDSALVNGNWYYASQIITDTYQTRQSCDSVIVTNLTINRSRVVNQTFTECDSALVNSNWYYTSQTVIDSFTTINGCDSIVITDLTINKSITRYQNATTCDNAYIHGKWYNRSQMIYDTFTTRLGCDSIVVTDLTTYYSAQTYQEITNCDAAQVHGNWYYQSRMIHDTLATLYGCDSVVTTLLTINKSKATSAVVKTCDSVLINGTWYNTSQTVTDSFLTQKGCDSVHTSYLSISFPTTSNQEHTICEGDSYQLPDGRAVSSPGDYISRLTNYHGCDSTVYTRVFMNYTYYDHMPDTAKCVGDTITLHAGTGVDLVDYRWSNGQTGPVITTKDVGRLYLYVTAANGCKSRDTIHVMDAGCPACPVYTPTSFTPNYNSLNDRFRPISNCEFMEFEFEIYNRWGERLFRSEDPSVFWDGTYLGSPVQQDVYVWIVRYIDNRSLIPIAQSGTVTVVR